MMGGPLMLKDAMLTSEDAVYHMQCSSNFQTGEGNRKKKAMSRKCWRDTTADKVFLEIAERIDSHAGELFDITILGKMMVEKLIRNNVL